MLAVLQGYLEQFGQLLDMRVFRKNCYGFAQYAQHSDAVMAILGERRLKDKRYCTIAGRYCNSISAAGVLCGLAVHCFAVPMLQ